MQESNCNCAGLTARRPNYVHRVACIEVLISCRRYNFLELSGLRESAASKSEARKEPENIPHYRIFREINSKLEGH